MAQLELQGGQRPMVWSVSALLLAAGDTLAARFGACSVRGEISGFNRASSGHCYFNLKDADGATASLRCAMFRRAAMLLDFPPRDGLCVELRGRVAVYEARGELQFVVEAMQQVGAGSLYEQFLRLKAKLEAQGLFDPARKRSIPRHPRRLGVVTSLGAAALRDVLTTLARRAPQVEVIVYPSLVQGAEAPAALVQALERAAQRAEVDTLLLVRGGGSLEDLWAFNDERVVRAVADFPMPIVCGVGHETDVSLADFAADLRAATPTAAAELAAPSRDEALERLRALAERMRRRVQRRLEGQAQTLDQRALQLARPAQQLARQASALQALDARRREAMRRSLQQQGQELLQQEARLGRAQAALRATAAQRLGLLQVRMAALDPRQVLRRGYAWITDDAGHAIVSARALRVGQEVRAVWSDGWARAGVLEAGEGGPELGADDAAAAGT